MVVVCLIIQLHVQLPGLGENFFDLILLKIF